MEKLPNRNIGDIQTGKTVDLSDYVKLTEFCKRWLQALKGS